ncbi:MAG: hypothetical protein DRI24_24160 [Deltaproteobacteria bacterium]|nr:MAG: hypothetical protein DRI24_24160 [Deltaproteobacteria bacterium]
MKNTITSLADFLTSYTDLILLIALLASTNAAVQYKQAKEYKQLFKAVDFFIAVVIASGTGVTFGVIARAFTYNQHEISAFVAVGTIFGIKGLNVLFSAIISILKVRLGIDSERNKP